jgi:hypothetical protein
LILGNGVHGRRNDWCVEGGIFREERADIALSS